MSIMSFENNNKNCILSKDKIDPTNEGNDGRLTNSENNTDILYQIRINMIKYEMLKIIESDDIPVIKKINEINKYNKYFGETKYKNDLLKGLSIDDF